VVAIAPGSVQVPRNICVAVRAAPRTPIEVLYDTADDTLTRRRSADGTVQLTTAS